MLNDFIRSVSESEDRFNDMMLDPGAFSQAERDEISLDSEASAALADTVMKEDFARLPSKQQDRLLDLLALESEVDRNWWKDLLEGGGQ